MGPHAFSMSGVKGKLPGRALRLHAVKQSTADRYEKAFKYFDRYVKVKFGIREVATLSTFALDACMEAFIEDCYRVFQGSRRQLCVNAMLGVRQVLGQHHRFTFVNSQRAVLGWKRLHPSVSAAPIPQNWVDVIALVTIMAGRRWIGLGLVVAFNGFLRIGELVALRGGDLLIPTASRDTQTASGVSIQDAKTGRLQFARIKDPAVARILRFLKLSTAPGELVFRGATPADFNHTLAWACQRLGIPVHFTMHSLRHGRASLGFLQGDLPEEIRLEGRWASTKVMETYLQAVVSLLTALQAPAHLVALFSVGSSIRSLLLKFV